MLIPEKDARVSFAPEIDCNDLTDLLMRLHHFESRIGDCREVLLSENQIYVVRLTSGEIQIPRDVLERWQQTSDIADYDARAIAASFEPVA